LYNERKDEILTVGSSCVKQLRECEDSIQINLDELISKLLGINYKKIREYD